MVHALSQIHVYPFLVHCSLIKYQSRRINSKYTYPGATVVWEMYHAAAGGQGEEVYRRSKKQVREGYLRVRGTNFMLTQRCVI